MAQSLLTSWRSFWHTMLSDDRHASHDSPYRTGQHMPLNSSRSAALTSIATPGITQADLDSPYDNGPSSHSTANLSNAYPASPRTDRPPSSPTPYSPGMRSSSASMQKSQAQSHEGNPFESVTPGEIQLQNFQEGLPPPPPVSHSWKRIDRWAEDHYEELFDQLSGGASNNDLNELEHMLDCSLPMEVRESLQVHDGQERGGQPTGIIFGCMLLDCEEIVQEWQQWRRVNHEYLTENRRQQPQSPFRPFGGSSSSAPTHQPPNPLWRQDLQSRQDSQPPNAIQKAYAHPGWIPLARDWGGNNLAVDLAPGPMGKWGQVIIFGRDYDCKYVVARSWSAFLATVADDLGSEKVYVDEETSELKLREFKTTTVEPGYLDILRWRMDQKYGRKGPKRRSGGPADPHHGHGHGQNHGQGYSNGTGSPYGSSSLADTERGRSTSRPPGPAGPSPLARVTEEASLNTVSTTDTAATSALDSSLLSSDDYDRHGSTSTEASSSGISKLVEAPTPRVTGAEDGKRKMGLDRSSSREEIDVVDSGPLGGLEGLGVLGIDGADREEADGAEWRGNGDGAADGGGDVTGEKGMKAVPL